MEKKERGEQALTDKSRQTKFTFKPILTMMLCNNGH